MVFGYYDGHEYLLYKVILNTMTNVDCDNIIKLIIKKYKTPLLHVITKKEICDTGDDHY